MTLPAPVTAEEVERGFNNRVAVPDHLEWFARWAQRSREAVAALSPRLDLRYGSNPKETLDLFVPQGSVRGVLVFIHGGYWRSLDKADHGFVAPAFVAQGIAVANLNYDLCPQVSIATIVEETRRAVAFLAREAPRLGIPAAPLVVSGHSAGGHLAAMLLSTPAQAFGLERHPLTGAVSLSGIHDLAPLLLFSYNADLRLTEADVRPLSPVHLAPAGPAPIVAAVGGNETDEFLRQTDLLWDAWPTQRLPGMAGPLRIAGRHHFDVVFDYADPDSLLTRATLGLF